MTVIGIVSDTHLPRFGTALPRALVRGLRQANVERILHLGDLTEHLEACRRYFIEQPPLGLPVRARLSCGRPPAVPTEATKGSALSGHRLREGFAILADGMTPIVRLA